MHSDHGFFALAWSVLLLPVGLWLAQVGGFPKPCHRAKFPVLLLMTDRILVLFRAKGPAGRWVDRSLGILDGVAHTAQVSFSKNNSLTSIWSSSPTANERITAARANDWFRGEHVNQAHQ